MHNNKYKCTSREDWSYLTFDFKVYRAQPRPSTISRNLWIQTLHEKDQIYCSRYTLSKAHAVESAT